MIPIRIQRRRTKGFRLPPEAICISRPGKWSNPFKLKDAMNEAAKDLKRMIEENIIQRPVITIKDLPKEKVEEFKKILYEYLSGKGRRHAIPIRGLPEPTVISLADTSWLPYANAILLWKYEKWLREMIRANPKKYDLDIFTYSKIACWCKVDEPCHGDVIIKLYREFIK